MVYKLGRFLQLVGLIILPVAMAGEAAAGRTSEPLGLGKMLMWACLGIGVFMCGHMLQQSGGKSE